MSRLIRIISKKITKSNNGFIPRTRFTEYTNSLSEFAKKSPGFVSSNSYWETQIESTDNPEESIKIISISEWKTLNDWNKWYQSMEREKIHTQYKDIIDSETFFLLNKKAPTDDIFLL